MSHWTLLRCHFQEVEDSDQKLKIKYVEFECAVKMMVQAPVRFDAGKGIFKNSIFWYLGMKIVKIDLDEYICLYVKFWSIYWVVLFTLSYRKWATSPSSANLQHLRLQDSLPHLGHMLPYHFGTILKKMYFTPHGYQKRA